MLKTKVIDLISGVNNLSCIQGKKVISIELSVGVLTWAASDLQILYFVLNHKPKSSIDADEPGAYQLKIDFDHDHASLHEIRQCPVYGLAVNPQAYFYISAASNHPKLIILYED